LEAVGDVEVSDPLLIDLPHEQQVARGQELMQMLHIAGMPMPAVSSTSSPASKNDALQAGRLAAMQASSLTSSAAVRVIVRRTFIELVPAQTGRKRAYTDSEVFDGLSKDRDEPWQKISESVLSDLSDASTDEPSGRTTPVGNGPDGQEEDIVDNTTVDATFQPTPAMGPEQECMDVVGPCWMPMGTGFDLGMSGMQMMMAPGDWNWASYACAMPFEGGVDGMYFAAGNGPYDCATEANAEGAEEFEGPRTTVMLRNLPSAYSRTMLIELLEAEGFTDRYDFVYLPIDFNSQAGLGYAFVNFLIPEDADFCQKHFEGFCNWSTPSEKVCSVTWAGPHQGLYAHVQRYRNSPVMHESVPDEWKPAMFVNGTRMPFPPPTVAIRKPKIRRRPEGLTTKAGA